MTASVQRSDLLHALKTVAPALSRNASTPALNCVRIVDSSIRATDLDTTITARLDGLDGLDVLIPAAPLTRIVAAATSKEIRLEASGTDIVVKAGFASTTITGVDPTSWAPPAAAIDGRSVTLTQGDVSLIERTLHAVSDDQTRAVLTAVRFTGHTAEATDSYRLCRVALAADFGDGDTLIPAAPLTPVLARAVDGCTLHLTDRHAVVTVGDVTWTIRLVDGSYPTTTTLWVDDTTRRFTVSVDALIGSIKAALSLHGDDSIDPPRITVDNEIGLTVARTVQDVGDFIDTIPAELDGKPLAATGFNPKFLLALLDNVYSDDVTFRAKDPVAPIRVTDGSWDTLLMPVRVTA